MEEKQSIEELLNKIHISIYDEEHCVFRTFTDVIEDLAQSWETLNDDYKNKLYEAMGIMPNKTVLKPSVYFGSPRRYVNTGLEYLENQPTCKNEAGY